MTHFAKKNGRAGLLSLLLIGASFWGCEEELGINTPGNLVPLTVDKDLTQPSIEVNGTVLHAESFGQNTDPMVIFLHGGPGGDYRNSYDVMNLSNKGYYVVFYDQRGSGLSKRHPFESYTIKQYIDDLSGVIDYYRTSPTQKVFLFGHSWGGMLAAAYINDHPDQIDGVILAEPGGFTDELAREYGEGSRKLRLFSESTNDAVNYDQFITGKKNDHQILDYKLSLAMAYTFAEGNDEGIEGPSPIWRLGAVVLNRFSQIADEEGFDFTPNLGQFDTKVLFLYSENNKAYGLKMAQKEAVYFPNADIVRIDDTGHEMIYFRWDNVQPVVLEYLNSLK